jgi:molecular chaperone GrpE
LQAQHRGEVGQQRTQHKPSANNPEEGLPPNPTGSESQSSPDATSTENGNAENAGEENLHAAQQNGPTLNDVAEKKTLSDEDTVPRAELLALAAEFQNFRNAANRRLDEARDRAARGVLEDLLPVLDNLEMGLKYVRDAKDADSMRQGIEFIAQQFRDVMKNHGVEPIPSQGQTFDPLRHDAIEQVQSDQPEGTVVEEAQRGYSYKGQILRPARVKVAGQ